VSVTALSLSPNMDVLATTHVDQNGVYLWYISIACLKFGFMILLAISWDTTLFKALGCSVWILFLKGVVLRKLIEGDALLYLNRNQIFN
jgi:hypothetical protein